MTRKIIFSYNKDSNITQLQLRDGDYLFLKKKKKKKKRKKEKENENRSKPKAVNNGFEKSSVWKRVKQLEIPGANPKLLLWAHAIEP